MKLRCLVLVLSCAAFCSAQALAESPHDRQEPQEKIVFRQEVENIFQKALDQYLSARYELVEGQLESLLEIYPTNHRITGILYLLARAHYFQGKLPDAQRKLHSLINSYPQSDYVDDSTYLLAAISFKQGQYYASGEKLFTVLETASDPRLRDLAVVRLPALLLGHLEAQQVQYLRDRFQSSPSQQLFALFDAVGEHLRGNRDHAQGVLQRLLAESLSESYRDEVRKYISTITNLSSGPLKIGVILPITGFFEEEAKAL
ncbi:MAG: outer membrane protein assembly factor BamD, partial [bacterium]